MNARRAQAIVAAALARPELLSSWQQEPELLRDYGVDPRIFDLETMWKFVGLMVKVRHNKLRVQLPMTFRLMTIGELEIEVFASYATHQAIAGRSLSDTSEARLTDLLSFLEHWLNFERHEHTLLWDLIRHEEALTRLSAAARLAPKRMAAKSLQQVILNPNHIPRICGDVVLLTMRSDPRIACATLRDTSPQLSEVPLGTFHFCYWRPDDADEINIVELDEVGFYTLSLSSGKRSIGDLSKMFGGGRRPAKQFLDVLRELAAVGVLMFDTKP
jgi:hypothetical protein